MSNPRKETRPPQPPALTMPLRVLIVEDEMLPAMLLEEAVTMAGHEARKASRLAKAFELADAEHFDGAVLDVNVNGQQVFTLAARLRHDGVPLLFATGYGEAGVPAEFRGCAVLQKPYALREFNAALENLLSGAAAHDGA